MGWQTGGVLKRDLTLGITKGHVNGKIMRARSPHQVSTPLELVIRTPEGTSVTEYQLLRLDEKDNRREFRALTGGIIHSSGGAEKNAVPFEPEKVTNRGLEDPPKGSSSWRIWFVATGRVFGEHIGEREDVHVWSCRD